MIKSSKKLDSTFRRAITTNILILFLLSINAIQAQSPTKTIMFQGYLSDANNIPVTGLRNMEFELYDVLQGGIALWDNDIDSIEVVSGVFSVELGDESTEWAELKFDKPYWISIRVASNLLPERIKLSYAPYSLSASAIYGESNVFPGSGNVGIDTKTPTANLHINDADSSKIKLLESEIVDVGNGTLHIRAGSGRVAIGRRSDRVGIGTPSPTSPLHVTDFEGNQVIAVESRTTNDAFIRIKGDTTANVFVGSDFGKFVVRLGGGPNHFVVENDGSIRTGADQAFKVRFGSAQIDVTPSISGGSQHPPVTIPFGYTFDEAPRVFLTNEHSTSQGPGCAYLTLSAGEITESNFKAILANTVGSSCGGTRTIYWIAIGE